jgi:type IV secretion/conjugal transfer VirB4 family ATPase
VEQVILISALTVTVFTGFGFLAAFWSAILAAKKKGSLKNSRSKGAGFVDLLKYGSLIDDGIVLNKNGSLTAAWAYRADDEISTTFEQRNLISERLSGALLGKGRGWMIQFDALRFESDTYSQDVGHFPDPVTAAIDAERRKLFTTLGNMYDGLMVVTVTWFPPTVNKQKFLDLLVDDDAEKPDSDEVRQRMLSRFKDHLDTFERALRAIPFDTERLKSYEIMTDEGPRKYCRLLQFFQYCITGKNHPIALPNCPAYIDQIIGAEDFWTGIVPKLGDKYIAVVAVEGLPERGHNGILNSLAILPLNYRFSSRFIILDNHEALSFMEKYRKKWNQKVYGWGNKLLGKPPEVVDEDALKVVNSAKQAITAMNAGNTAQGFYTACIVMMDTDLTKLEDNAKAVAELIRNMSGFAARVETVNAVEAYLGSLPAEGDRNIRRPLIESINFADLVPTSNVWAGRKNAPCPFYPVDSPPLMHAVTSGSTPYRFNLHVGDVGHTLIVGPTGAGKSTLVAIIEAQFRRYPGATIISFDKGMSLYALTMAAGGYHYEITPPDAANASGLSFCPLQHLETKEDRLWAMDWVEGILVLNGINVKSKHRKEIGRVIQSMHETGDRTLTDFASVCQDDDIRAVFSSYTVDSALGALLDGKTDTLDVANMQGQMICFEIEELMGMSPKYCMPVLQYLFRRIEKSLKGQPVIIDITEAWLMFEHPFFLSRIKEWLKVLRKANAALVMDTQNISDAAKSQIMDVMLDACATKIYLPNPKATMDDNIVLYQRMGLNKAQIKLISSAVPKRHYYISSVEGSRIIELALGPLALAFVAVSSKEDIAQIKLLIQKHGDQWVDVWLSRRNLSLAHYQDAS